MAFIEELERAVLDMLLAGEHPILEALRLQAGSASVAERKLSGVGFFTTFLVPPNVPSAPGDGNYRFGDVVADVRQLAHGAGFLLLVKSGRIYRLEGYSFDEGWPVGSFQFSLRYVKLPRDLSALGLR